MKESDMAEWEEWSLAKYFKSRLNKQDSCEW